MEVEVTLTKCLLLSPRNLNWMILRVARVGHHVLPKKENHEKRKQERVRYSILVRLILRLINNLNRLVCTVWHEK